MTFVQMMNEAKTNNVISYSWNFIRNLMFHNATMWLNYALMDKKKLSGNYFIIIPWLER